MFQMLNKFVYVDCIQFFRCKLMTTPENDKDLLKEKEKNIKNFSW